MELKILRGSFTTAALYGFGDGHGYGDGYGWCERWHQDYASLICWLRHFGGIPLAKGLPGDEDGYGHVNAPGYGECRTTNNGFEEVT